MFCIFQEEGTSPSTYTRNDLLSGKQIKEKLAAVTNEKKSLKRKVQTLEMRLSSIIRAEGEDFPEDLSRDLQTIAGKHYFEKGSLQEIFWQQQKESLENSKSGHRWHPSMVRFCIGLHAKSPGAYDLLRRSGLIQLPSSRTLRDYSHFTKPVAGFNPDVIARIAHDVKLKDRKDFEKNVILTFDEVHIRQGLVYSAQTKELLGWIDQGDVVAEIKQIVKEPDDSHSTRSALAKQIMCIMVRGLFITLDHVVAYFPCIGFTGDELFFDVWKAVIFVEQVGFRVRALTCDGASSNRKFFKLSATGTNDLHYAPHPIRSRKMPVFFICDVPHLMKTARNCWENSGFNSKSRDLKV